MSAQEEEEGRHPGDPSDAPQNRHDVSIVPSTEVDKAIEFLERWRPGGPWILAVLGDGPTDCREFTDTEPMQAWIAEHQANRRNVYYQDNDCRLGENGKPARLDVIRATCLHVDIDPKSGLPIDEAQAKIQEAITTALRGTLPPPTVDIASGGGRQLLWKLTEPFEFAEGDEAARVEFERYNQQIAQILGGDNCHPVCHLLRVPGTVNFPDDHKRAKNPGRDDALARIVSATWDTHELPRFVKAPQRQDDAHHGGGDGDRPQVVISNNVRRLGANLSEELPECDDKTLGIIVLGHDPDALDDGQDRSASGWTWHVACQLVRDGVDDERIYAVLTDPDLGISKHVLSQGSPAKVHRAAIRAIQGAKAEWGGPLGDPIDVTDGRQGVALQDVGVQIATLNLFERSGDLVRPIRLAERDDDGDVKRARGALIVERMTAYALRAVMSRACHFVKHDARSRKGTLKDTDPTVEFTKTFLGDRESWKFRVLAGVTGAPVFTAEGEVVTEPGHDPATGLWLDTETLELPPMPDRPTRDDALAAHDELMRPFRGYPIPDPACRSVLAAAMIATVITPTVDSVPVIGITSTSPGFGKTKIQQCIGIMATGIEPAFMSWAERDEENDKRLDSCLLAGDPVIGIDNVTRPIGGDVLCSIVSNPAHKPRVLGQSHMPNLPSRVQVTVNGNNLAFMLDVCRRALLIVIDDPDEEHPEHRPFDFDPVDEVRARRPELLAAVLTILRAWHCAGRPEPDRYEPLGLSTGWEPVRKALLWLGKADPAETQTKIHADDPEREHRREMLDLLWEARGAGEFRAADLQHDLIADGKLTQLGTMMLDGPSWNPRKVGNKLRQLAGRWIDGVRLVKVRAPKNRGHVYRVHRKDGEPELEPEAPSF